jgi:hypothetical protein
MKQITKLRYDSIIAQVMFSALLQKNQLQFVNNNTVTANLATKSDTLLLDDIKFQSIKNGTELTSINSIVKNTIIKYLDPDFEPHQQWLKNYSFISSRHLVKRTYQWWLEQPQEFISATEDIMFEVKLLISGYTEPV